MRRVKEMSMRTARSLGAALLLGGLVSSIPVRAADSAAGEKTFTGTCAACHKLQSYAGKSETELQTEIKGIVAGTVKHPKKLTLSADDIANVAAYIAANEPK
jgi:mono/diheme cytochrome c family protein